MSPIRRARGAERLWFYAIAIIAISTGMGSDVQAEYLVINSVLGERVVFVDGIESMSQQDVSYQAVLLALSDEGWGLAAIGGEEYLYGPPGWVGGIEWAVVHVPAEVSNHWGFSLNEDAVIHGNDRSIIFHTDDTVSRSTHDICEPSPYGIISGLTSGTMAQCGQTEWGVYYVVDNPPISSGSQKWGTVKATYR